MIVRVSSLVNKAFKMVRNWLFFGVTKVTPFRYPCIYRKKVLMIDFGEVIRSSNSKNSTEKANLSKGRDAKPRSK
jgi:hypothetical protein